MTKINTYTLENGRRVLQRTVTPYPQKRGLCVGKRVNGVEMVWGNDGELLPFGETLTGREYAPDGSGNYTE